MANKRLAQIADQFAARYATRFPAAKTDPVQWDYLRDALDIETGAELDYQPLNFLTDMVAARIAKLEPA